MAEHLDAINRLRCHVFVFIRFFRRLGHKFISLSSNGLERKSGIFSLIDDDEDISIALSILMCWRKGLNKRLHLTQQRLRMQRIERDRRIFIVNFFHRTLPAYSDIQFFENFRMSRSTFEVFAFFKSLIQYNPV